MRKLLIAIGAALVMAPAIASAQAADKPAAKYTTAATEIGTLLDDPAAKAVLQKHVPELVSNEQIEMARGMTLKTVQQYAPDQMSDKKLADIDADLAKLTPKAK